MCKNPVCDVSFKGQNVGSYLKGPFDGLQKTIRINTQYSHVIFEDKAKIFMTGEETAGFCPKTSASFVYWKTTQYSFKSQVIYCWVSAYKVELWASILSFLKRLRGWMNSIKQVETGMTSKKEKYQWMCHISVDLAHACWARQLLSESDWSHTCGGNSQRLTTARLTIHTRAGKGSCTYTSSEHWQPSGGKTLTGIPVKIFVLEEQGCRSETTVAG